MNRPATPVSATAARFRRLHLHGSPHRCSALVGVERDAYIAAAGIDAPADDRAPYDTFSPPTMTELDLDAAGIRSIVWATGYRLEFGWVDLPIFEDWGYPLHVRGVTTHPGLYAVGLPWLHSEPSAAFAGVGADVAHVVEHIVRRGQSGHGH